MNRPPGEWMQAGACRTADPELFYYGHDERGPTRRVRDARAKKVCAGCPVVDACLTYALENGEVYGTWGGLSEDERAALHRPSKPVLLGAPDARPAECLDCERPLVRADDQPAPPGHVRHAAKGVCRGCYSRANRTGDRRPDPAMQVDAAKVDGVMTGERHALTTAERTEVIRRVLAAGGNDSDAARRIGISAGAVFKHRRRWLIATITPRERVAS